MLKRKIKEKYTYYTGCHKYVPIQTMFIKNVIFEAAKLSNDMTTAIQQIFYRKSSNRIKFSYI